MTADATNLPIFEELKEALDGSKPSLADYMPPEVQWKFQVQMWLGFLMFYGAGIGGVAIIALGLLPLLAIPAALFEVCAGLWFLLEFKRGELVLPL